MTKISIMPIPAEDGVTSYHAVAGNKQSIGRTPGEALDALTDQLPENERGTLVVVQSQNPDQFFSADQIRRLAELMERWRIALRQNHSLSAEEQAELDALVEVDLQASSARAAALLQELSP